MSKIRVLKLGGSLLTRPDWPTKLRSWIDSQPVALNLLIVGGGELVEAVRELDCRHQLDTAFAHWLCIDLLASTVRIAGQLLPELPVIEDPASLRELVTAAADASTAHTCLVQVAAFYSPHARTPLLPEDWTTTSDALAAWLARRVQADELVLFKSVEPPSDVSSAIELADKGIVDAAMAGIMERRLNLRVVNLAAATVS